MTGDLSYQLHVLTARMDRAADRILRVEQEVSYRRFLALLLVGKLEMATQRALAEALGVSEPSVSRMTSILSDAGLLDATMDPAGGNRRRLALTRAGEELVERCRAVLEHRFADLVQCSGVPYRDYAEHTGALIRTLDVMESKQGSAAL